jgi:hypothetical protein
MRATNSFLPRSPSRGTPSTVSRMRSSAPGVGVRTPAARSTWRRVQLIE